MGDKKGFRKRAVKSSKYKTPIKRYRKKFGNPNDPKNRALGHVRSRIDGHLGVVVPGVDGETPWKLSKKTGIKIEKDEEESLGSNDSAASEKFEDLAKDMNQAYQQIAVGAVSSLLDSFALTEEQRAQECQKQKFRTKKKKQGASGECAHI